ncbi:AAA family ATPase [Pseudalkalibacillus berkeleyi]|uniref:AAA family ATPase n=1 Tax=Pseudalkalibacillus berkeleyi TaxID=1069813 RepID=A0ABS9GWT4_9BACL|nr:AAA family ATPase [Pseudalkalibacillus berkeleyi]MCF6137248.1 AAA family ATPase [Pseudalkalibacillus berkeleyi]
MNQERNRVQEKENIIRRIHTKDHYPPNAEIELLKELQYVENQFEEDLLEQRAYKCLIGQLHALIAKVRLRRSKHVDSSMRQRLDHALSMSGNDQIVNEVVYESSLIELYNWITNIELPVIRETDNVPAKRKAAEDIIDTTGQLGEIPIEQLVSRMIESAQIINETEYIQQAKQYEETFERVLNVFNQLRSVSDQYRMSLSGSFHPSALQSEMKELIREFRIMQENIQNEVNNEEQTSSALLQLNDLIGMSDVKNRVQKLYQFLQYQKKRQEKGFRMEDELSLNMVLTGDPGTGKTTIARLLANLFYDLGLLEKSEVTEVDRSQLVGSYVGQTEENTMSAVQKAVGGVLFIDEAYTLKRDGASGNDYGQTAIDTLVSAMTNSEYAGKFAVILAGYPEEMRQFLQMNPGLQSRFPESNHIYLPQYSNEELLNIAEKVAFENDYTYTPDALKRMEQKIDHARIDDSFGNARTIKNLVMDVIFQKGSTLSNQDVSKEDYTIIHSNDVVINEPTNYDTDPDDQLNDLVGLDKIKAEMKSLSSFIEIQQMRREEGLPSVPIQLHSVFVGNPGTGKTTVASIYANLLKKKGFLKRGHLVVAGRSDLVAGYTGQTALKTRKKVREALGGVLFIDEAYSLYPGKGSDFGKEAINTLVEEMTKHNENLVVILAGYPNEIQQLINSNPGLSSRFKKYFQFEDYSVDQIVEIMSRHTAHYGYEWDEESRDYLTQQLTSIELDGNGRFAVDLINTTIQLQAHRIMSKQSSPSEQDLVVLKKEDFENAMIEMK